MTLSARRKASQAITQPLSEPQHRTEPVSPVEPDQETSPPEIAAQAQERRSASGPPANAPAVDQARAEVTSLIPAIPQEKLQAMDEAGDVSPRGPATWLIVGSAGALIILAAAMVFWPGATLLDRLRALDGGICAQLPTHSFFPGGQQLPLCSRNTGIYLGYTLTFLTLFFTRRGRAAQFPRWPMALVLFACIAALGVDGFNSLFLDLHLPHLYQPHNLLRLTTGLLTGAAMACFLLPVTNAVLWKQLNEDRSIDSWWQLLQLLPILALAFLAVGTQAAIFLYPVAVLSTLGVITVLSLINLTAIIAISGKACRLSTYRHVFPFFSMAFLLAVGELEGLFILNHWLLQQLTV